MKRILIIGLAIFVSACGKSGSLPPEMKVSDGYGEGDLQVVTLRDGTRCAVIIGNSKAAIHCDWAKK